MSFQVGHSGFLQILAIQEATKESVGSIEEIGATIASVNEIATAIAAAVEVHAACRSVWSRPGQSSCLSMTQDGLS